MAITQDAIAALVAQMPDVDPPPPPQRPADAEDGTPPPPPDPV